MVAARLSTRPSERAAEGLVDAMGKTSDCFDLVRLAECFEMVGARLPDPAAVRAAVRAADHILDAMGKTSTYDELETLAACFEAVEARLSDPAAERAAERLVDVMVKIRNRAP